jgi:hypothetical protein
LIAKGTVKLFANLFISTDDPWQPSVGFEVGFVADYCFSSI